MTALQLNAEIYRAMGEIADNETLLAKVLVYVTSRREPIRPSAMDGLQLLSKHMPMERTS